MADQTLTQPPPDPAPPGWRRRVGSSLLVILLVLLAVEVALRVFMSIQLGPRALLYGTPFFRQEISVARLRASEWRGEPAPKDDTGDARLSPPKDVRSGYSKYRADEVKVDHDETGERISYQLNHEGFRAPNFEIAKPPGVVRIVTLGASSTFGLGSRDNETYPSQLQSRLNQRCGLPLRYEVINLGIPHLTSHMIRELFVAEGVPLHPDVVTFYEGYNDTAAAPDALSVKTIQNAAMSSGLMAAIYAHLIPVYRWIRDWSMSLLFVDNALQGARQLSAAQVAAYQTSSRIDEFEANLSAMRDAAGRAGAKFIVVTQQSKSFFVPRESIRGVTFSEEKRRIEAKLAAGGKATLQELYFLTHYHLMEALRTWARAENVPLVDGIARLDDRRDLLYTWVHLTPQGNALLADAIADEILHETCR